MPEKIIKEYLKCPLTEAEMKAQAEKMAQNLSQIAGYEADLKSIKKSIESDIARCQADLGSAVEKFRSGFEMRNVDCEVDQNFATNTVTVTRLDTGEIIRERAMSFEERQGELFNEKKHTKSEESNGTKEPTAVEGDSGLS